MRRPPLDISGGCFVVVQSESQYDLIDRNFKELSQVFHEGILE